MRLWIQTADFVLAIKKGGVAPTATAGNQEPSRAANSSKAYTLSCKSDEQVFVDSCLALLKRLVDLKLSVGKRDVVSFVSKDPKTFQKALVSEDPKTWQKAFDNIPKVVELKVISSTFQGHQKKFRNDASGRLELLVDTAIKRNSGFFQPKYTYQEKVEKKIRKLKKRLGIQDKILKYDK